VFWYTLFTSNNLDITNLGFVLLPNHNVINCAFHRAGCVSYLEKVVLEKVAVKWLLFC